MRGDHLSNLLGRQAACEMGLVARLEEVDAELYGDIGLFKVSANPKLTVLHNCGFLYDSINIRNSFRLKISNKKCYSYGKL